MLCAFKEKIEELSNWPTKK